MLVPKEYYKIVVKNNETANVFKIEFDEYNGFQYNENNSFEYVYHTKSGEIYPLHKNIDAGIDILLADDKNLNELLKDMFDQGYCDNIEFNFIDDYFNGNYKQYGQAF